MSVLERFRLDDRTVIITGASSGLGVAFAVAVAEAGANVILGARRIERLEETQHLVEKVGRRVAILRTDVSQPSQCAALVGEAMRIFGRVDVLVNNAGIGTAVPATRETSQEFEAVVAVNLNGSYWMAQQSARVMKPGSSIINISSVLGMTTAG
jgi:NAD(P)-dependent dehydrogenase (short-subunit alcohol dehydrogenase family)